MSKHTDSRVHESSPEPGSICKYILSFFLLLSLSNSCIGLFNSSLYTKLRSIFGYWVSLLSCSRGVRIYLTPDQDIISTSVSRGRCAVYMGKILPFLKFRNDLNQFLSGFLSKIVMIARCKIRIWYPWGFWLYSSLSWATLR